MTTASREELLAILFPSKEVIDKIIQLPGPFADEDEEIECKNIVENLTTEEITIAAYTSYAYWVKDNVYNCANGADAEIENNDNSIRIKMAMKEARRHYTAQSGNSELALQKMKNTILWRKEKMLHLFRLVFLGNEKADTIRTIFGEDKISDEEIEVINKYRTYVERDIAVQSLAVRGHDVNKRAIAIKFDRKAPMAANDEEEFEQYRMAQLYLTERVIAVTEIISEGVHEKVFAMYDFYNYSSWNKPPSSLVRESLESLQEHYPERAYRLVLTDAPFWLRSVVYVLRSVLSTVVMEKLLSVSGDDEKRTYVTDLVDIEQAMPFMLPDGKLTTPIESSIVLDQPFHFLYDDDNTHWQRILPVVVVDDKSQTDPTTAE